MKLEFNPENYLSQIEESKKRLHIARNFKEPDRVPITISTGGSFYSKLFGFNIRDYYTNLDTQIEVQVRGLKWAFEELQDDRVGYGINLDLGPIHEGIYFNLPIEYPDDTSPWVTRTMSLPEAVEKLETPDPENHPGVLEFYKKHELLKEKVSKRGLNLPVGGRLGIHPPLSAACGIVEPAEVFMYLVEEPQLVHKLFEKLLIAFIKLQDFADKYFGINTTYLSLADDHSAFISDEMYRQHIMPYNMILYARYGIRERHLHADGPNDHHFKTYANIVKLTSMDIGGFSDIANAKPVFKDKVFFSGGLNCKDLYYDLETAQRAARRAISIGAPGGGYALAVGGETYAGVNPDTLIQTVKYAKEIGRYPISTV